MHRECQNLSPASRAVLGILVRQPHLPLLSCSSWLTLILLSQTPVLIPEDFNIQVVEPSTAPPNDSTHGVAACSYGVTCCGPCTTPASCQAHLLQSPPCTGLLPSGMLTPQAYFLKSPALLTFLFTGPSTVSALLHTSSSLTTLTHLKPCPLCLCTVTVKPLSKSLL